MIGIEQSLDDFILKGVTIMTLRELVSSVVPSCVNIPNDLCNMDVVNPNDFCRFPLVDYFSSSEFQHDLHTIEYELSLNSYAGLDFYLILNRDEDTKEFNLMLKSVDTWEAQPDGSEHYFYFLS